jgi:hypothetical protein
MPSLPKEIAAFMEKFGVDSDEVWPVPGGKAYAVKHKALERIAIKQGIVFERPSVVACDLVNKSMVICTFAKMGDLTEWSFGEASPANNKNQYMAAMAEKRAKDRVILKLLAVHGDIYSEEEADDFKRPRQNVHDNMPEDFGEVPEEDLVKRSDGIQVLTVDAQRPIYAELEREIATLTSVEECKRWTLSAKGRASRLSDNWRKMLNAIYLKQLRSLEKRDAVEYIERATG